MAQAWQVTYLRHFAWKLMGEMDPNEVLLWLRVLGKKTPIDMTAKMKVELFYGLSQWERDYVPSFSLEGKRVLDVGAGCGETAWFFFGLGASSMVCIEPDWARFKKLVRNIRRRGWDARAYNRGFRAADLFVHGTDFCKIDCEGGEDAMLGVPEDRLPPLIMELHYAYRYEEFRRAFPGMQITHRANDTRELWMARWKA